MTFVVKVRGERSRPLVAEYRCPEHGVFAVEVMRDENGDAPDAVACPEACECDEYTHECGERSTWTPSAPMGIVKRWEVVRGKYEKPERKTFLDTRKLGEGQSIEEFRAERRKVWEDKRHRETKELLE